MVENKMVERQRHQLHTRAIAIDRVVRWAARFGVELGNWERTFALKMSVSYWKAVAVTLNVEWQLGLITTPCSLTLRLIVRSSGGAFSSC